MPTDADRHLVFWYQALAEPIGIRLYTENRRATMQQLYRAREKSGDPQLRELSIVVSPVDQNELWIAKQKPELSDAPAAE